MKRRKLKATVTDDKVRGRVASSVYWHLHNEEGFRGSVTAHPDLLYVEQWRDAASKLIGKVASVIAGRSVSTRWTTDVPIAATDGKDLLLSADWFADRIVPSLLSRNAASTAGDWASFKGVAYHEVAHILWTPRFNHKPVKDLGGIYRGRDIWNLLEDQRIEGFFVARYKPAIPYFTRIVLNFVVDDKAGADLTWLWLHGRKYLPAEVRSAYRTSFEHALDRYMLQFDVTEKVTSDDFAKIIDEYRTLVFPADGDRAVELIAEFSRLMALFRPSVSDEFSDKADRFESGHSNHKVGRTVHLPEEREDRDRMLKEEAEQEKAEAAESDSPEEEGPRGDGAEESGPASNAEESSEPGPGNGDPTSYESHKELREMAEQFVEQMNSEVHEDGLDMVRTVSRMVDNSEFSTVPSVNDTYGARKVPVEGWMRSAANRLTTEIMLVTSEGEEAWVRKNSSGRLNVLDVMESRGNHFDVFDIWEDTDEDELSFEVVILMDRSSSMEGYEQYRAAQALWVLRSAFDRLEIPTTVIGYDDHPSMMSVKGTPITRDEYIIHPVRGGTEPTAATRWASSVFKASRAKNRLMVSVTDGMWSCHPNSPLSEVMETIEEQGVQTLFLTIGGRAEYIHRHRGRYNGHREWVNLTRDTMAQMPKIVGSRIAKLAAETIAYNKVA